jgi:hypothetical protein
VEAPQLWLSRAQLHVSQALPVPHILSYAFKQIQRTSPFCADPGFFFLFNADSVPLPIPRSSIQDIFLCISLLLPLVENLPTLSLPSRLTQQYGLMQLHSSEQATILCDILARSKARTIEGTRHVWSAYCTGPVVPMAWPPNFMS